MGDVAAVGDVAELIERLRAGAGTLAQYHLEEDVLEAASRLAALQQRVEDLQAEARAMFPKEPYPAQPHGKDCPGCTCGLDARQAATIAALKQRAEELEQMVAALLAAKRIAEEQRQNAEARERVLRDALIEAHKALWVSGRKHDDPLMAKIDAALSADKEGGE